MEALAGFAGSAAVLKCFRFGPFGSVAEHSLGKGEVPGPIPGMGTIFRQAQFDVATAFAVHGFCNSL